MTREGDIPSLVCLVGALIAYLIWREISIMLFAYILLVESFWLFTGKRVNAGESIHGSWWVAVLGYIFEITVIVLIVVNFIGHLY